MSETRLRPEEASTEPPEVANAAAEPAPTVPDTTHERLTAAWALRTGGLLLGVLALAVAFIAAYAGVLHKPTPRGLPVAVSKGDATAGTVLDLARSTSMAVRPVRYANPDAAQAALRDREVYAVVISDPRTGTLRVTTASAGGPAAADAVLRVVRGAAAGAKMPVLVTDAVPVSTRDPRGLVPFYLVVGLVLGGYLAATVLGLSAGTVPRTPRLALARVGALLVYAVILGLIGALLGSGRLLDVWGGHTLAVALSAALVVFAAAAFAAAVQAWLGLLGTGLVILVLVVLGNPGSGGIYPPEFLPGPFRTMHLWNPSGLGLDLVRAVASFDHRAIGWPVGALAAWSVLGAWGLLRASARHRRRVLRDAAQR